MPTTPAITNKIKTEMSTYLIKQSDWDAASSSAKKTLAAMRLSNNSIEGSTETLDSDVKLPGTRIKAAPDTGTSSSSGALESDFFIDEFDELIASAMCSHWVEDSEQETGDVTEYKTLELGTDKTVWRMIKKFSQTPTEWKEYTGLQVNTLAITFALNSFVQLSFNMMGANNPKGVSSDPVDSSKFNYGSVSDTQRFKTLIGYIKMGALADDFSNMTAIRQAPNFEMTINNNKERTDALFETEAIEMSDGDFEVSGSLDLWKADAIGMSLFNDSVDGVDKCIEIEVDRTVGTAKISYTFQLKVHLQNPTEAKDGNKYKVTAPWSVNVDGGIKIIKKVESVS